MLQQQLYVKEKLDEIEAARRRPALPEGAPEPPDRRRSRPVIGPVARAAGRRVRRLGEALESWATPARAG